MSKERELLKGWLYIAPFWIDPAYMKMYEDTKKLLAEPEQEPEEGVHQKLSRIEDGIEVEILPSELWQDGYETGKRSVLLSKQPEQEPVAWMWDEMFCEDWTTVSSVIKPSKSKYVDNVRPLYLAPPKREPLINIYVLNAFKADDEATHPYSYWAGVEFAEKHHGIVDEI